MPNYQQAPRPKPTAKGAIVATLVTLLLLMLVVGGGCGAITGVKAWHRSQKRADANNQVKITHILIRKAQQQAQIVNAEIAATRAQARKRIVEAQGLAEAQRIIHSTLTPLYVQHEAIQAQERIATSGRNNTVIYVPAGTNGTPVITEASKP